MTYIQMPMSKRISTCIFICAWWALGAYGQGNQFVASIHPTEPSEVERALAPSIVGGPGSADPGRIKISRMSLRGLIAMAFEITPDRLVGSEPGLNTQYDITANIDPASKKQDLSGLLKGLLRDRFELKVHDEEKTKNLYRLVVAKSGIKVSESHPTPSDAPPVGVGAPDKDGFPILPPAYSGVVARASNGRMLIRGQNASLTELIKWVQPALGRAVIDGTGLVGKYDFKLAFRSSPNEGNSASSLQNTDEPGDSVFDALSLLGLRVESISDTVKFIMIDSIRKEPLPN